MTRSAIRHLSIIACCFVGAALVTNFACTTTSAPPDNSDNSDNGDNGDNGDGDNGDNNDGDNPEPMAQIAVFADPDSDFTTTEVRDVDGEEMQFNTEDNTLIWLADGSTHNNWTVSGNNLLGGAFRVRFGTEGGVPHAYFTEASPPTVCDLSVPNGVLRVTSTTTEVPQN